MARFALGIEYDGSQFCGWQTQKSGCSVQDAVESALSAVAAQRVATICAGRTDAGVHATAQVVHFDSDAVRPDTAWVRGVNALLPDAVAVQWVRAVPETFHARYGALERRYHYLLLDQPVRPALNRDHVGWIHQHLDIPPMQEAALALTGEHDFSAFRSSECQAKSPVRRLRQIRIERRGDYVVFEVAANAFLHHMVRNIVGTLVYIGSRRKVPGWAREVLESRDRSLAAPTISGAGLYLTGVDYEAGFLGQVPSRSVWFNVPGL